MQAAEVSANKESLRSIMSSSQVHVKQGSTAQSLVCRQLRERHTKLEEFASWLGLLRRVQSGEGQRVQQEEIALALWDMYLAYGGKPLLEQHQDKFDDMKEDSAVFTKVAGPAYHLPTRLTAFINQSITESSNQSINCALKRTNSTWGLILLHRSALVI